MVALRGSGSNKPFFPFSVFRKTGMLTYFLAPQEVGKGLGGRLLDQLAEDAKKKGMTMLVANMSNEKRSRHPLPQDPWVFRSRKHCRCRAKIRGTVRCTLDAENGGVKRLTGGSRPSFLGESRHPHDRPAVPGRGNERGAPAVLLHE